MPFDHVSAVPLLVLSSVKYKWKGESNHRVQSKIEVKSETFLPHPVVHLVTNPAEKQYSLLGFLYSYLLLE